MGATPAGVEQHTLPKPAPKPGEVRVRVHASAINPAEEKVIAGGMVGRFLHVYTRPLVLGWDFAGTVDAVGTGVTDLAEGDAVWGHLAFSNTQRQGAFAECITIPASQTAKKPDDVSFELAAAAATVSMTALQSLRDLGRIAEGGRVLVIGSGGGIGAVAVGIPKRLGAHVTGLCSTRDVERSRGFGADEVIDRTQADAFAGGPTYDVVFDTPAAYSFGRCAGVLNPGGAYVTTLPDGGLVLGMLRALFSSRRCHFVQVASKRADLDLVGGWLSDGLQVPIDSTHPVADLGTALARQQDRSRVGRVVVDVAGGWGN